MWDIPWWTPSEGWPENALEARPWLSAEPLEHERAHGAREPWDGLSWKLVAYSWVLRLEGPGADAPVQLAPAACDVCAREGGSCERTGSSAYAYSEVRVAIISLRWGGGAPLRE